MLASCRTGFSDARGLPALLPSNGACGSLGALLCAGDSSADTGDMKKRFYGRAATDPQAMHLARVLRCSLPIHCFSSPARRAAC